MTDALECLCDKAPHIDKLTLPATYDLEARRNRDAVTRFIRVNRMAGPTNASGDGKGGADVGKGGADVGKGGVGWFMIGGDPLILWLRRPTVRVMYSANDLLAGYSVVQLKELGLYDARELKDDGRCEAGELLGLFNSLELREAGYSAFDLKVGRLRNINGYLSEGLNFFFFLHFCTTVFLIFMTNFMTLTILNPAPDLKGAGADVIMCKDAGYSAAEMRAAGWQARRLTAGATYALSELPGAGFTPQQLKAEGFTVSQLQTAGYGSLQLKLAGYAGLGTRFVVGERGPKLQKSTPRCVKFDLTQRCPT